MLFNISSIILLLPLFFFTAPSTPVNPGVAFTSIKNGLSVCLFPAARAALPASALAGGQSGHGRLGSDDSAKWPRRDAVDPAAAGPAPDHSFHPGTGFSDYP